MLKDKIAFRWIIAVMIFTSNCVNYMMRVNLSVNIIAMVPVSNVTESNSQVVLDWTPYQRAYILGGYFWGYLVANLTGGPIATAYWGSQRVVFCSTLICAVLTLLSPIAAKHSFGMMLAVRIVLGFFGGFLFPSIYFLIGNWAIPSERGKFLGALIGGSIGTFITWTFCGLLIESYGWEWGFYAFGIFALSWAFLWWFLVYDSPEQHPLISISEKEYICKGTYLKNIEKISLPLRQILTSKSVISLCLMSFGNGWGIYFIITAAPNYVANALGYSISSTGILSAVIYLLRSSCCFIFGSFGDFILKRELLSSHRIRLISCVLSHIVPGILLLCLTISGYPPIVYITIIITAMSMNGFVTLSSVANVYDLTNNFVTQVSGLSTACLTLAGIISPLVTAHFTKYNETHAESWRPVFYIASSVFVASGLQFLIFGSTKTQAWDKI